MPNIITLTSAEEKALQSLAFSFSHDIDRLTLASLDQRGLARCRTSSLGTDYWELTPWGEEVLAAIDEPLEGWKPKVW